MSRSLHALVSLSLVGASLGACASEEKDSGYDSGLDSNAQFGNLTPDQKVSICTTQAAYVHAHVDTTALTQFLCAFTPAVLTAADDAKCEVALADCVNAFSVKVDVKTTAGGTPPECITAPLSQCQGTVGDYENCVDQLAEVQVTFGSTFTCGKRHDYAGGPTAGLTACGALGPTCSSVSQPPVIR